jgi:hypothetical protein
MAKKKRRHNWVRRAALLGGMRIVSRHFTLSTKQLRLIEQPGQPQQHLRNVSAAEVAKLWRSEKAPS